MPQPKVVSKRRLKIVADMCRANRELPSKTIARKLYAQHPKLFTSLEVARSAVRLQRGVMGDRSRKHGMSDKSLYRPAGSQSDRPPLPKSIARTREPYILEAARVLILGDLHIPFHDRNAVEIALRFGERFKPDAILWNGDIVDFESLSTYDHSPDAPNPEDELLQAGRLFAHVSDRFPKAKQIFRLGNHEDRWQRYIWRNSPKLHGCIKDTWQEKCGIEEFEMDVVGDKRVVMSGLLSIFHGHEVLNSSVYPAKALVKKLGISAHCNHFHRTSSYVKKPHGRTPIKGTSQACLCNLSPDFMPYNEWSHGFATNEVAKDGTYNLKLYEIIDGRVTSA